MRIAILGAPGSDKGTQAKLLAERYRVPRISVEDLASRAADGQKSGGKAGGAVPGKPVDERGTMGLLEDRLRARDSKRGFIIYDFPGNIPEAQTLDTLLGMLGWVLQISVHLKVGDETLVRSITGRMRCEQCNAAYNRHFSPPQTRGKCDQCGGKVLSESRKNAKTAELRVREYHEQTAPLLAYYKAQHKLRTVMADGSVEEIQQKICDIVDLEIRPLEIKTIETAAQTHDEKISTVIAGGQISRIASTPKAADIKPAAKTVAKPAAKPVATKKATPKKPASKTTAKKKPISKVAKKPITKKPASKPKIAVSKTAPKKSATKATAKKKPVSKVAKKPIAKKAASKKPAAAKTATKTIAKKIAKKPASKPRPTRKTDKKSATKSPAKKAATKKATKKK